MEETPQDKIIVRLKAENSELKKRLFDAGNVLWSLNKNYMIGLIKIRIKVINN